MPNRLSYDNTTIEAASGQRGHRKGIRVQGPQSQNQYRRGDGQRRQGRYQQPRQLERSERRTQIIYLRSGQTPSSRDAPDSQKSGKIRGVVPLLFENPAYFLLYERLKRG